MIKIAWVSDFDPLNQAGGAQLTDKGVISYLDSYGEDEKHYYIDWIGPSVQRYMNDFSTYDLAVISNYRMFSLKFLQNVYSSLPIIKFEHDSPCKYRSLFPMAEKCKQCPLKKTFGFLYVDVPVVTLSPLHSEAIKWIYEDAETTEVPSPVDYRMFPKRKSNPNNDSVLMMGATGYRNYTTAIEWIKEHPNKSVTMIANGINEHMHEVAEIDNVTVMNNQHVSMMPKLFHMFKTLIHFGERILPFERTVMEARLSGMKIITNRLVGVTSYGWWNSRSRSVLTTAIDNGLEIFRGLVDRTIEG